MPGADAAEAGLGELGADGPFEETHFGTGMTTVRDPAAPAWKRQRLDDLGLLDRERLRLAVDFQAGQS